MRSAIACLGLLATTGGCLHAAESAGPPPIAATAAPTGAPALAATARTRAAAPSPAQGLAPPPTGDAAAARAAVTRALAFLEREGDWWLTGGKGVPGGGKCVSCHVVGFTLWAHREAARAGLPIASARIDALEQRAFAHFDERPAKAHAVTWSQLLLARERPGADAATPARWREVAAKIVRDQAGDGSWTSDGQFASQRRPEPESDAVATMWAAVALASLDQAPATVAESRRRARAFVAALPAGVSNEALLARLLVERELGDAQAAAALLDTLRGRQQADGGWSWLAAPGHPSDALATGQALYALARSDAGAEDPAVRGAVDYLLRAQRDDATWIVPAKLVSTREGGGKIEYIYKYWGTAWATIGLARTLARGAPQAATLAGRALP